MSWTAFGSWGVTGTIPAMSRIVPKQIALVAHDNKKDDLLRWAAYNRNILKQHRLIATGTTGKLLSEQLDLDVKRLQSGPLGGDLQIGAMISERKIDMLIFFWDPLEAQPHDPDIKALLRIAVVWNIPVASNVGSADFIISSPLMATDYKPVPPDYSAHNSRLDE